MTMTDPIADLLTRIRNANLNAFTKLEVPSSKFKVDIVKVLKEEGYIKDYRVLKDEGRAVIKIFLKYADRDERVIKKIERVSRPSRRVYVGRNEIPRVKNGLGVAIISTPQGVMSDRRARKEGIGGEVLCTIW
ncbi:30S ribosomal protein S8 [bacterium]|nr:30S ribosomal protein S8 [bacterium]